MRRLVEFIVAMLPLDVIGRRALDETFADWRHEEALARSAFVRARVAIGGLSASVSVVARGAVADFGRADTYRVGLGTVGVSLLLAAVLIVSQPGFLLAWPGAVSWTQGAVLRLYLLPMTLAVTLPLAALAPPYSRRGAPSLMGLALALTVLSGAILGWILPKSNQAFRESVASIAVARGDAMVLQRGVPELSAPELVTLARRHPDDWRVWQVLNTRAAHVLAVPICLLLGAQARRLARARGWRSGGRLIAWAVSVVCWGGALAGSATVHQTAEASATAALRALVMWSLPVTLALAAIILAGVASRWEQRTAVRGEEMTC